MTVTIKTNHQWRNLAYRYEVPAKVLASEFDWLKEEEDGGSDGFFCYRGNWYHVADFMRVTGIDALKNWDGYTSDSYFSGVVIRLSKDGEQIQVGTYMS